MFAASDDRPGRVPAEKGDGPGAQDRLVRDQVQRIRLDLLARETERLDRRLEQILDQQKEDRRQRENLQGELANLCLLVDKLISMKESEEGGGGTGADLRDTVKPLLQAVVQLLNGPAERPPSESGSIVPPQVRQPPANTAEPRRADSEAGQRPPTSQVVTARYPQPLPSPAPPADIAATPPPPSGKPQVQPGAPEVDDVEATAAALHKALSRLDLATRSAARARAAKPNAASVGKAATHRQGPILAPAAPTTRAAPAATVPAGGPAQTRVTSEAPPLARRPETRRGSEKQTPKIGSDSWDDKDDSLGVEDPAIEIARLLRPVNTRAETRPVGRQPEPAAPTSERRRAGETEPLQLGTPESPEIVQSPASLPNRPRPGDGPVERPVAAQAPRKARTMPPVADARAAARPAPPAPERPTPPVPERPAPPAASAPGTEAAARAEPAGTDPAARGSTSLSGLESPCEALPRCLTEPWDDAESGRWQVGWDKSPRRWPFRRNRSTGEATDRSEDPRSVPGSRRTGFDDGSEPTK